jgi:DNA-binding response OmpR family regulator
LANRLRWAPVTAHILALGGHAQTREKQSAIEAGFDHCLVKPVDVDRLLALLVGVPAAGGRQWPNKKMA